MAVAVVVHETAAGAEPWLIVQKPGGLGHIGKSSVAVIAIKSVLPETGAKDVVEPVIIVVADADSTGPSDGMQASFFGDVRECPVPVVFVKPIRRALGNASETRAAQDKQVHPAIVVVIHERTAASGGLHDVLFEFHVPIDDRPAEARGHGYVDEMCVEGTAGSRGPRQGLGGVR